MFFTVGPKHLNQPLIAHCEWSEKQTGSNLWVCSSQEQVQKLLRKEVLRHTQELQTLCGELPTAASDPLVEIVGDVASSLGSMLSAMATAGATVTAFSPPELGGFWEPPSSGQYGEGVLIWADEKSAFHLTICRSKNQAATIVRGFDWMDGPRRETLLNKVSRWNCRPESKVKALQVDGKVAELFYHASIWGKYKSAQRRSLN